ncbi:MAG: urease accessory protein UreD [Cruoricaptor ignavus]|nr:urease accessory protein UreD [Cruoricaptor ignavus]
MNINKDNSIKSTVKLSCVRSGEVTLLEDRFFDIPYKLTHFGRPTAADFLEMILMCSSPGVMEGDSLQMDILCKENAKMKFFTQSFNRIHPMPKKNGAEQFCNFKIEKGAKFMYVPHPTIPYKDSIFEATNDIRMTGTSHLIWGDLISGGRIHSGEKFLFSKYHTKTKIYRDERLIIFDNQLISPETQPLEELLFFEGYTHQGTLLMVSPFAEDFKKELDAILLEQFTDSSYGFTICAENALMLRILGNSGDALYDWLLNIGNMAWSYFEHRDNVKKEEELAIAKAETEKETEVKAVENKVAVAKKTTKTSTKTAAKTSVKTASKTSAKKTKTTKKAGTTKSTTEKAKTKPKK